jgi:organic hydroperoxide reductase OsmC/OhrA
MGKEHHYAIAVEWTGNRGTGTSGYRDYDRNHRISADGNPDIPGSSDPSFRGDPARWNPEELLLASISACHKLWYLHLCADAGVTVISYRDDAVAIMEEDKDTGGRFTGATLRPHVTITAGSDAALAMRLHHDANHKCYVANSLNFKVAHEPVIETA